MTTPLCNACSRSPSVADGERLFENQGISSAVITAPFISGRTAEDLTTRRESRVIQRRSCYPDRRSRE